MVCCVCPPSEQPTEKLSLPALSPVLLPAAGSMADVPAFRGAGAQAAQAGERRNQVRARDLQVDGGR